MRLNAAQYKACGQTVAAGWPVGALDSPEKSPTLKAARLASAAASQHLAQQIGKRLTENGPQGEA
jgi:hypothetical protein